MKEKNKMVVEEERRERGGDGISSTALNVRLERISYLKNSLTSSDVDQWTTP